MRIRWSKANTRQAVFILLVSLSLAQNEPTYGEVPQRAAQPLADDPQQVFKELFDEKATDEVFLASLRRFENALPKAADQGRTWHSGQTDYRERILGHYRLITSITYYNSSFAELAVSQLLLGDKIIRYSHQGGDYHVERGLIVDPANLSERAPKGVSIDAFYAYDLGIGVRIRCVQEPDARARRRALPLVLGAGPSVPCLHDKLSSRIDRTYFAITKENTPSVFIERH